MRVGYVMFPKDIDARMWSSTFDEFIKCPECGFRTDFFRTNPQFRFRRKSPDFSNTYDRQYIVTEKFREFALQSNLTGASYTGFSSGSDHFHFKLTRTLRVDESKSHLEKTQLCGACGNYEEVITGAKPVWLENSPDELGFYRTNFLFGSGNRKFPFVVVNDFTKELLMKAGLTGMDFSMEVFGGRIEPATVLPNIRVIVKKRKTPGSLAEPSLTELLNNSTSGFICKGKQFPGDSRPIRVEHRFLGPASEKEIAMAGKLLAGMSGQLLELYRLHNGVELYAQPKTDNSGVRLAPVSEWKDLTKEARNFLVEGVRHPKFVAVGEVPGSGNYFVVPLSGEYSGTIALIDHETGSVEPFADDVNHFLRMASEEPVSFLMDTLGGYIRYSAEGSDDWMPEKYLPDIRDGSEGDRE